MQIQCGKAHRIRLLSVPLWSISGSSAPRRIGRYNNPQVIGITLVTIILFTLLNSGTNVAFHTGLTHTKFSGLRDAGCLYVYVSTISDNRNHRRRLTGGKPAGLAVVYSDRCAGGGDYERNPNTPTAGSGRGLDGPCGHLARVGGDPHLDGLGSPDYCRRRTKPARSGASVAPRRNSVLPANMARSGISGCFAATG